MFSGQSSLPQKPQEPSAMRSPSLTQATDLPVLKGQGLMLPRTPAGLVPDKLVVAKNDPPFDGLTAREPLRQFRLTGEQLRDLPVPGSSQPRAGMLLPPADRPPPSLRTTNPGLRQASVSQPSRPDVPRLILGDKSGPRRVPVRPPIGSTAPAAPPSDDRLKRLTTTAPDLPGLVHAVPRDRQTPAVPAAGDAVAQTKNDLRPVPRTAVSLAVPGPAPIVVEKSVPIAPLVAPPPAAVLLDRSQPVPPRTDAGTAAKPREVKGVPVPAPERVVSSSPLPRTPAVVQSALPNRSPVVPPSLTSAISRQPAATSLSSADSDTKRSIESGPLLVGKPPTDSGQSIASIPPQIELRWVIVGLLLVALALFAWLLHSTFFQPIAP